MSTIVFHMNLPNCNQRVGSKNRILCILDNVNPGPWLSQHAAFVDFITTLLSGQKKSHLDQNSKAYDTRGVIRFLVTRNGLAGRPAGL